MALRGDQQKRLDRQRAIVERIEDIEASPSSSSDALAADRLSGSDHVEAEAEATSQGKP